MKTMNMLKESINHYYASKPNIVLIVSDDHGYGDLSFHEVMQDVHTPQLDRLRQSGMLMQQGYVSAPICSPSRAGLMVGSYQQRWGAKWFSNSCFAPRPFLSLAEVLKMADYRTGYFGKIHYGADQLGSRECPDQHGFDESFYGLAAHGMGRLHYLIHDVDAEEKFSEKSARHGMSAMYENGKPVSCYNHLTHEFAQRSIDFIEQSVKMATPFFCMTAFNAVHNFTWQLPKEELEKRNLPPHPDFDPETESYIDWYDGAVCPNLKYGRAYYLAQLELMDQAIGKILDTIEQLGQQDNTLIIYVTDNGGSPCNYGNNTPLYGSKYTLYEGGVRVPFIASWHSRIKENTTSNNLVSTLDLLPTFAYLAGVEIPDEVPIDGNNLIPTLEGQVDGHEFLHFDTGFQWSIRDNQWKLISRSEEDSMREKLLAVEHCDIGQGMALYPIGQSLDESIQANQSDKYPELVDYYEQVHQKWEEEMARSVEKFN